MVFTLVPNTLDNLLRVCISLVSMIRLYLADRISLYQTSSFGSQSLLEGHLERQHWIASNHIGLDRKMMLRID